MNVFRPKLPTDRFTGWIITVSVALLLLAIVQYPVRAEAERSGTASTTDSVPLSPGSPTRARTITDAGGFSMLRTTAALAGIIVAVIVVGHVARRFVPGLSREAAGRTIHILSQTPLGSRGNVYVLRCGPRILIIGATASQLTTLAEIADPDEIAEFARLSQTGSPSRPRPKTELSNAEPAAGELRGQLDGMLNQINRWKTSS